MMCPYCLNQLNSGAKNCVSCSNTLPEEYVKLHSNPLRFFAKPPAVVSVVGFPGHGKSVYLASLYYMLMNEIHQAWDKFFRQGLTLETLKVIYDNIELLQKGQLPPLTPQVFPRPNIDRFCKMPRFGDRTLLIYDPPGQAFELGREEDLKDFAGFVKYSPCVIFLVSLTEEGIKSSPSIGMSKLLDRYIQGVILLGGKPKKQHLIVVYTKADRINSNQGKFDLPGRLKDYLGQREIESLSNIDEYLDEMDRNSKALKNFTESTLGAKPFINSAEQQFLSVEYCVVSALGSEPRGAQMNEDVDPRRVIDPLLWVLSKS